MDKAGVMDPVSSLQRWLGVPVILFVFFSKKEMKSQKKKVRHSHAILEVFRTHCTARVFANIPPPPA